MVFIGAVEGRLLFRRLCRRAAERHRAVPLVTLPRAGTTKPSSSYTMLWSPVSMTNLPPSWTRIRPWKTKRAVSSRIALS